MPSPFPGIDPYLESPLYWQDFHECFLPYAAEVLQPQLPDRYRARIGERVILHGGAHTVTVPRANLIRYAPFHGLVSGWRAAQPRQYEVYFVRLHERLPRLRIPLLPGDHDVALDLPAIYTRCYAAARYDPNLDYMPPPPVELSPTDLVWLENWLWDQGQRTN